MIDEIAPLLEDGYELARDKRSKIVFVKMRFTNGLEQNDVGSAYSFLDRVIGDLTIKELKYKDDTSRNKL